MMGELTQNCTGMKPTESLLTKQETEKIKTYHQLLI